MVFSMGCIGTSAPMPGVHSHLQWGLLPLRLVCLQGCFSHIFLTLLSHSCCAAFYAISPTCFHWGAPTVVWSWLEPTVSNMEQSQLHFTQQPHSSHCQHLNKKAWYRKYAKERAVLDNFLSSFLGDTKNWGSDFRPLVKYFNVTN